MNDEKSKLPVQVFVKGVEKISRIHAFGTSLFLEDKSSGDWYTGSDFLGVATTEKFVKIEALNKDERVKGKIKLLHLSSSGLWLLTGEGELFKVPSIQNSSFCKKVSFQSRLFLVDIATTNSSSFLYVLDSNGKVHYFDGQTLSKKEIDGQTLSKKEIKAEYKSLNIEEKVNQVSSGYENCLAIGVSGSIYNWGM